MDFKQTRVKVKRVGGSTYVLIPPSVAKRLELAKEAELLLQEIEKPRQIILTKKSE